MPNTLPDISIITPSFNNLSYLKCCYLSIADQKGINIEHIVIDGGSTDGTVEWLQKQKNIRWISEKDNGMYDAINKGLGLARGKILAYLNCDEQYLSGTLLLVKDFFEKNSGIDILFGDSLLIRPDGNLIAYRKSYQLRWYYILSSHLYVLSCTIFWRRKILENGIYFNSYYKAAGDADFIIRLLKNGFQIKHINQYLAAFTMTGNNLSENVNAKRELLDRIKNAPFWIRLFRLPLNIMRLTEKFLDGAYFQKMPLKYSVYVNDKVIEKKDFIVNKASFLWKIN